MSIVSASARRGTTTPVFANTFNLSPADVVTIRTEYAELVEMHGKNRMTLAQAAANEAGHIVVGHVCGMRFLRSDLRNNGASWCGVTRFDLTPKAPQFEALPVSGNPEVGKAAAAMLVAGKAGMELLRFCHPAAALYETWVATRICGELDRVLDLAGGWSLANATSVACTVLDHHRDSFRLVFDQLMDKHRLTPALAKFLLPVTSAKSSKGAQ